MSTWITIFGLFGCATVIALFLGTFLISELETFFPGEYRKAGSPAAFWIDSRYMSFLGYVLKGRFEEIPDVRLVAKFKVYRALQAGRLLLAVAVVIVGLAQDAMP